MVRYTTSLLCSILPAVAWTWAPVSTFESARIGSAAMQTPQHSRARWMKRGTEATALSMSDNAENNDNTQDELVFDSDELAARMEGFEHYGNVLSTLAIPVPFLGLKLVRSFGMNYNNDTLPYSESISVDEIFDIWEAGVEQNAPWYTRTIVSSLKEPLRSAGRAAAQFAEKSDQQLSRLEARALDIIRADSRTRELVASPESIGLTRTGAKYENNTFVTTFTLTAGDEPNAGEGALYSCDGVIRLLTIILLGTRIDVVSDPGIDFDVNVNFDVKSTAS
mmetsp:Transcript_33220/g.73302  ORF Transcript_33220/g.73302 Transcript_33220/m.73302 type:complete len:279 (-) Transcript_33220:54-890(-)